MEDHDNNVDDEEHDLSEHTLAMRAAFRKCREQFHQIQQILAANQNGGSPVTDVVNDDSNNKHKDKDNVYQLDMAQYQVAQQIDEQRTISFVKFWRERKTVATTAASSNGINTNTASIKMSNINVMTDPKFLSTPQIFYKQFHYTNIPCLIDGLQNDYYDYVHRHWVETISPHETEKESHHPHHHQEQQREQTAPQKGVANNNCYEIGNGIGTKNGTHMTVRSETTPTTTTASPNSKKRISRNWFRNNVGKDTSVPLRYLPEVSLSSSSSINTGNDTLDEDGRVVECLTKNVSVDEWIRILDRYPTDDQVDTTMMTATPTTSSKEKSVAQKFIIPSSSPSHLYLKDWHLQLFLENKYTKPRPEAETTTSTAIAPNCSMSSPSSSPSSSYQLYTVPDIFSYDLLNNFLLQFYDDDTTFKNKKTNDYRFCYWGPKDSTTIRHSDVLHSYSWSYNVFGTKLWTFYKSATTNKSKPTINRQHDLKQEEKEQDDEEEEEEHFTIIQHAGQAMFVPSMWQHSVINLEETISINHNWITTSSIDLTWDCLVSEMYMIEKELREWGIVASVDDDGDGNENAADTTSIAAATATMEPFESMLRGCVGLDVTSFFFMCLVRLLELVLQSLQYHHRTSIDNTYNENNGQNTTTKKYNHFDIETLSYDVFRLVHVLNIVMGKVDSNSPTTTTTTTNFDKKVPPKIQLKQRLVSILQSTLMANQALDICKTICAVINTNSKC